MRHSEAEIVLVDYAAGDLAGERRRALEDHLSRCPRCREWLATYRLYDAVLSPGGEGPDHPDAEVAARLAAAPESLPRRRRAALESHLESCGACRTEVALARQAVEHARTGGAPAASRAATATARLWLAAAVFAATIGAAIWLVASHARRPPKDLRWSDATTVGEVTLVARHSITAEDSRVGPGSNVRLRAGGRVAFGNGFSVGDGGSLVVELTGEGQQARRPQRSRSNREGP